MSADGERSPLHTPICDLFGIEVPIVLAGMGGIVAPSSPELVAAVSNTGGLGVLGGAFATADELAQMIERTRALTDRPFGVDTLLPMNVLDGPQKQVMEALDAGTIDFDALIPDSHRRFIVDFHARHGLPAATFERPPLDPRFAEHQLEVIFDLKPAVYVSGLGDPAFLVDRAHQLGMKVGAVVGASRHARKAAAGGVDFVVAQGHDGGGHNSRVGTFALLPAVVDAVGEAIPVLGAGAIMDGRGVMAALALGAQGVWCGSVFLATHEADLTAGQKQAVVDAGDTATVVTSSLSGKQARSIRSVWIDEFEASGLQPLPMPLQSLLVYGTLSTADRLGRHDIHPGMAGQGIGAVTGLRPAAEVVRSLVDEAVAVGRRLAG